MRAFSTAAFLAACLGVGCSNGQTNTGAPDGSADGSSPAPDKSCVVTKALGTMYGPGAGVFFTATDCAGIPIPGLTQKDLQVTVDGAAPSVEASATLVDAPPIVPFVTVAVDVSSSTGAAMSFPSLVTAVGRLVDALQAAMPTVRVGVTLIGASGVKTVSGATTDLALLKARLARAKPSAIDTSATDLFGGVVAAVAQDAQDRGTYETIHSAKGPPVAPSYMAGRTQPGGAFTRGYIVLVSDGHDTAGLVPKAAAVGALGADSQTTAFTVGLQTGDADPKVLSDLAGLPFNAVTAPSNDLAAALVTIADRISASFRASYVEWFCLPKQTGVNAVSLGVAAPKTTPANVSLDAVHTAATCFADFTAQRKAHACGAVLSGVCADGKFCDKSGSCSDFLVRPGDGLLACITLSSCKLFPGTINPTDPNQCMYLLRRELQHPGTASVSFDADGIRCLANAVGDCAAAAACTPPCLTGKNNGEAYCANTSLARVCERSFGMAAQPDGGAPPPNGPSAEWRHMCGESNGTCSGGSAPVCSAPADGTCTSAGVTCTADGAAKDCSLNKTAFTSRCDAREFTACTDQVGCGADCPTDNAMCAGQNVLISCGRAFDCALAGFSRCEAVGAGAHCAP